MKDLAEVCPLSREGMLHPLSRPLQAGLRFFRFPLPAVSSARLTAAYRERKTSGLPCFAQRTKWVRSALSAGGVDCPRESPKNSLCPPLCLCRVVTVRLNILLRQVSLKPPPNRTYAFPHIRLSNFS